MFINKKIIRKITLPLVFTLTALALTGCGDEEIEAENKKEKTPAISQDGNFIENENFELEDFSFYGDNVLDEDLTISAKKVMFRFKSKVKIKNFKLNIKAKEVIFEKDSQLFSYTSQDYNSCKKEGLQAGTVDIQATTVSGDPRIDLAGQNAGQIGIYLGAQVDKSHPPLKRTDGTWYKGCVSYVRGKYPKDVPHLMIPKIGGAPGKLLIEADDYSEFNPLISNRVSLGSYKALVEGSTKKISWWREVPKGQNGQPGEVCHLFNGDYLCK
jgi:hypothetical protein